MTSEAKFGKSEVELSAALLFGARGVKYFGEPGAIASAAMVGAGVVLAGDGAYRIARADAITRSQAFVMGVLASGIALLGPAAGRKAGKIIETAMNVLGNGYGWSEVEIQQLILTTKVHFDAAERQRENDDINKRSNNTENDADQDQMAGENTLSGSSSGQEHHAGLRTPNLKSHSAPNRNTGQRNAKLPLSRILAIARGGSRSILRKSAGATSKKTIPHRGRAHPGPPSAERLKKFSSIRANVLRHHGQHDHSLKLLRAGLSRHQGSASTLRIGRSSSVLSKPIRRSTLPSRIPSLRPSIHTALKLGRQGRPSSSLGVMHKHEKISGFAPRGRLGARNNIEPASHDPIFQTAKSTKLDLNLGLTPSANLTGTPLMDQWQFSEMLSRELDNQGRLPPSGATGFDPRLSPAWPGMKLPN